MSADGGGGAHADAAKRKRGAPPPDSVHRQARARCWHAWACVLAGALTGCVCA
jgi:hypothetical protein